MTFMCGADLRKLSSWGPTKMTKLTKLCDLTWPGQHSSLRDTASMYTQMCLVDLDRTLQTSTSPHRSTFSGSVRLDPTMAPKNKPSLLSPCKVRYVDPSVLLTRKQHVSERSAPVHRQCKPSFDHRHRGSVFLRGWCSLSDPSTSFFHLRPGSVTPGLCVRNYQFGPSVIARASETLRTRPAPPKGWFIDPLKMYFPSNNHPLGGAVWNCVNWCAPETAEFQRVCYSHGDPGLSLPEEGSMKGPCKHSLQSPSTLRSGIPPPNPWPTPLLSLSPLSFAPCHWRSWSEAGPPHELRPGRDAALHFRCYGRLC